MSDIKDFNDVRWDSAKPSVEDCGWHTTERDAALIRSLKDEVGRLQVEIIQMRFALGYPMPAELEKHILPSNPFKCGLCEARAALGEG